MSGLPTPTPPRVGLRRDRSGPASAGAGAMEGRVRRRAMTDETILPLSPRSRPEDVEKAQQHLERNALAVSQNRYQPKIIWTRIPWRREELQRALEAEGSPFVVLDAFQALERKAIFWAGAPYWAQYAYVVMVEVKAVNVSGA